MGVFLTLMGASITVSAETDSTGDLFHRKVDATDITGWSFEEYTGDKPNIDITDLSYTTTDTQLTITMTVAGVIEDKQGLAYYAYILRDTVGAGNIAYYTNSFYYVWGDTQESATSDMTSRAGTDTITFTIDYADPGSITGVWGFTYEVADIQASTSGEYWGDWAPNTYFPAYDQFYGGDSEDEGTGEDEGEEEGEDTGDEGTGEEDQGDDGTGDTEDNEGDNGGTPGFELLAIIAALAIALIILRRRK